MSRGSEDTSVRTLWASGTNWGAGRSACVILVGGGMASEWQRLWDG